MVPKGKLIIIGGAEDKGEEDLPIASRNGQYDHMEILKSMLPSNQSKARIEVITTASDIGDEVKDMYQKAFAKIGYENIGFMDIQDKMGSRDEQYIKRIEDSHTVLFSGGDQFKIATILGGTPIAETIFRKYCDEKDFILAGTSAGAMAISRIMIYSGGVHEALFDADLRVTSGLGYLK